MEVWNSSWAISNPKRWCCESAALTMPANLKNSAVATELEKVSFHFNHKERQCSNYCTNALISHTSKVIPNSKSSKPGITGMWTVKFQMFKLDLEKAEEPEFKLPTSLRSSKKKTEYRKTCDSVYWLMPKILTVWITTNCGKLFKRWQYHTTWLASWEICMQVKKQQLELDMEQQTGSK